MEKHYLNTQKRILFLILYGNISKNIYKKKYCISSEKKSVLEFYINQGDHLKKRLVLEHQSLVIKMANKYKYLCNSLLTFDDLIQSGTIGLIYAIDNINPYIQISFESYCFFWIKKYLLIEIKKYQQPIFIPDYIQSFIKEYNKLPKNWSIDKKAQKMNVKKNKLIEYLNYQFKYIEIEDENISLISDKEISTENHINLFDGEFSFNKIDFYDQRIPIILKKYFGLENENKISLKEISNLLGITPSYASKLKQKGLQMILHHI